MKNTLIVLAAFWIFIQSATAQQIADSVQTTSVKFLLFSARSPSLSPLSPGHAFVSFGSTSNYVPANINATYGFYPCEGCNLIEDERPGRVVKGFWKNRNNKPLFWLAVTADTCAAASTQKVIDQWSQVRYNLVRRNCVKFISEVAAAQGLKTPSTTRFWIFPKLPQVYILQLKKANPNRAIQLKGIDRNGLPIELDENNNKIPDLNEQESISMES